MIFHNRLLPVVTITGSSLMVGCGGNSGGSCGYGSSYGYSGVCGPVINVSADGYYEGTLNSPGAPQGNPVVSIIADNGDGAISAQDGTYYRLNVSLPGNTMSGTFYGISQGASFPNGTHATTGSISGVASPVDLKGTVSDQTGALEPFTLNLDPVYNLGSSLATLAGTWSYSANTFKITATIRPDGTFSGTDSNNCTYTGAFGIIDPNLNAYSENYTRLCAGVSVTFTGLAAYFPPAGNTTVAEIKLLADDHVSEFFVADFQ